MKKITDIKINGKIKASTKNVYFPFYVRKSGINQFKFIFLTKKSLHVSEEKNIQEEIAAAEQSVKKIKTKKRKWWNIAFLVLNIGIILFIFLTQDSNELVGLGELLWSKIKWGWAILAIVMVAVTILINSLKFYDLIYKATGRHRRYLSYKVVALGKYYDSITPLSSGGEPYQVYYLNSRSIRGELATSIPMVINVFWQISFVIISIIVLIINAITPLSSNPLVTTAAWISLVINTTLITFVIVFSISKKVGPRITIWVLKLLYKMHIIKNYQSAFRKVVRFVSNYQRSMRYFTSHFETLLIQIFLAIAEFFCNTAIVYFIYLAFQPSVVLTFWDMFLSIQICNMATFIMPLPGGAMAAEYSFDAIFSSLFPTDVFIWAMLFWRILTYYIYVLQGLAIMVYDYFIGNKKAKKLDEIGYFKSKTILTRNYELDRIEDEQLQDMNEVPDENLEPPSIKIVHPRIKKKKNDTPTKMP